MRSIETIYEKLLADKETEGKLKFYYPMPDYKLPDTIYSDHFLPKPGMLGAAAAAYDRDRPQMFDEAAAWEGILKDGQFPYFANSFLVFAS